MQLLTAAENSLLQLYNVLAKMTDMQYQAPIDVLHGATIGQHARHIIDFYLCIINNADSDSLSYDNRMRDAGIEQCVTYASQAILNIIDKFDDLDLLRRITVEQNFSVDQTYLTEQMESTIGRELMYGFDHAVHHMAFIKIGLRQQFSEISIDQHLGVAPSTVRNRN